ncbi:allantoate permease [Staphylotrichum tortipilum]|uniref:Allantoate permease n=1 Tax=Staphylotrichum tortipilum TaxID=2831512 RepID=A0AAN6RS61_9PEZI|nr:allantoate permease [Staphylotrichum longicolle]
MDSPVSSNALPSPDAAAGPLDKTAARNLINTTIDLLSPELRQVNKSLHSHPETAYEEVFAHKTLAEFLESRGFAVKRHAYGLDTAFEATFGSGGRHVVFCAEYDALPGIGHACGHNLIATSSLAAFLAAARVLSETKTPGRLRLLGTPAEEGGGGKIELIKAGAFDPPEDISAAIMAHPAGSQQPDPDDHIDGLAGMRLIASAKMRVEFRGRTAHASSQPWMGINALDAAVSAYNNVSMMRQQIRPDERIHGVFEVGGTVPNVVPGYTRMNWYIRSPTVSRCNDLVKRAKACFEAGAAAAGCEISYTMAEMYSDLRINSSLCKAYVEDMAHLGLKIKQEFLTPTEASTDMGNVSHLVPSFHGAFPIPTTPDVTAHNPKFAARILRKLDICLLPIMATAYLFQFLDKAALSYTAILGIRADLHLTGSQYSWSSAIYYFGYLIATYPVAGVLMVRYPVGKLISASLLTWGAILMLTALCSNAAGLLATRFFLGVTESGIAPGMSLIVAMWYTRSEQPLRQGAWFLGNTVAGLFGGLIGYGLGHVDAIAPWKVIFLVFGGCTVAFSALCFLFLPDTPLNARFLTPEERAKAVFRVENNLTGIKSDEWKRGQVIEALCDPSTWFLVLLQLASNIPNNGIITYAGIIIMGFGFSKHDTLLLSMVGSGFQLFFVLVATIGSTHIRNSRTYFMAFNLAVSMAGSIMARQIPVSNKYGRLMGVALSISCASNFPLIMAMTSSNMGGFTKKATVSALTFLAYCVGNIIGPQLFFDRETPSYPSGFLAMIICFAFSLVVCFMYRLYLIRENKRRDSAGTVAEVTETAGPMLNLMDKTDKEIPEFRYVY